MREGRQCVKMRRWEREGEARARGGEVGSRGVDKRGHHKEVVTAAQ